MRTLSTRSVSLVFMDTVTLNHKFARMGARLKLVDRASRFRSAPSGVSQSGVSLDVKVDRNGEFFEIARDTGAATELAVIDVQPADRHLLLLVRDHGGKHKFLCGHDERHWFVAAIPESAPVGTVRQAQEALKPAAVHTAQARHGLRAAARSRRKNAVYIRQGEWFFLPSPDLVVDDKLVLRHEPLRRSTAGKPHWAELCYRTGGETVYVCSRYPRGVTEARYRGILTGNSKAKDWNWRLMRRDAAVFVRGRIRHADHKTVTLQDWHQVLLNTENESQAMRNVVFLD